MKKWITVLLCIVLCLSLVVPVMGTNTQGVTFSATLSAESLNVSDSEQTVTLQISGSPAFATDGFSYIIEYPEGWTPGSSIVSKDFTFGKNDYNPTYSANSLRVAWMDIDVEDHTGVSDLGTVTFTIPANAKGSFTFKVKKLEVVQGYGDAWETGSELSATLEIKEVVLEKEETPTAKFTATGPDTGKLTGLVDGGSYKLTGASPASFTASGSSQSITGVSEGTLTLIKKGDG